MIMKKKKSGEYFKAVAATVLSIALFSAAFAGVNRLAFAAATDSQSAIPLTANTAGVPPAGNIPPNGYQKPNMTVYLDPEQHYEKSDKTISHEEAAELGAQYIWEVFGESADGMFVEMCYTAFPFCTRTYWSGAVAGSKDALSQHAALYRFKLDAITGERIGVSKDIPLPITIEQNPSAGADVQDTPGGARVIAPDSGIMASGQIQVQFDSSLDKILDAPEQYKVALKDMPGISSEIPGDIDEFASLAAEYAQKHFNKTSVSETVFKAASILPVAVDRDKHTVTFEEKTYLFTVTDETGREAEVVIASSTGQLLSIDTMNNDIVPGYDADSAGALG